jgi:hypothetical protein
MHLRRSPSHRAYMFVRLNALEPSLQATLSTCQRSVASDCTLAVRLRAPHQPAEDTVRILRHRPGFLRMSVHQ